MEHLAAEGAEQVGDTAEELNQQQEDQVQGESTKDDTEQKEEGAGEEERDEEKEPKAHRKVYQQKTKYIDMIGVFNITAKRNHWNTLVLQAVFYIRLEIHWIRKAPVKSESDPSVKKWTRIRPK